MPIAMTLRLSEETAAPVAALAGCLAPPPDYPPHVTLSVLPEDGAEALALAAAARLAPRWSALPVVFASLGLFPGPPPALFLAPVVTPILLARHGEMLAVLPEAALHPHHRASAWVPHVTLASGLADPHAALGAAPLPLPISALLDRMEVVRFPPAEVLARHALAG